MKRSLLRGVKSLKRCRLRQGYSESLREQAAWQATDYADVTDLWDSRLASDTDALASRRRGRPRITRMSRIYGTLGWRLTQTPYNCRFAAIRVNSRAEEKRRSSAALQNIRVIRG